MPRMEDKIRRLCSELVVKKDDEEVAPILVELREALRLHIQSLRERFSAYPFLVESRARNDISSQNKQGRKAVVKGIDSQDVGT